MTFADPIPAVVSVQTEQQNPMFAALLSTSHNAQLEIWKETKCHFFSAQFSPAECSTSSAWSLQFDPQIKPTERHFSWQASGSKWNGSVSFWIQEGRPFLKTQPTPAIWRRYTDKGSSPSPNGLLGHQEQHLVEMPKAQGRKDMTEKFLIHGTSQRIIRLNVKHQKIPRVNAQKPLQWDANACRSPKVIDYIACVLEPQKGLSHAERESRCRPGHHIFLQSAKTGYSTVFSGTLNPW